MKLLAKTVLTILLLLPVMPAFSADNTGDLQAGKFGLGFFFREPLMIMEGGGNISELFRLYGVSATYQVNESFALDPFFFWKNSDDKEKNDLTNAEETEESNIIGGGIGLFYCSNIDGGLNLYTGPRIAYYLSSSEREYSSGSSEKGKDNGYEISLVFGLKYMLNTHLGIFADISAGYSASKETDKDYNSSGVLTSKYTDTSSNLHFGSSLFGITFYF